MIDVLDVSQLEQTEIDPKTHATTVHSGLRLPDGGEGFIIIGRVVRTRNKEVLPLKDVISKILIEYDQKYEKAEDTPAAEENPVPVEQDNSGEVSDGEQAVSGEPRSDTPSRKRGKRVQKGG